MERLLSALDSFYTLACSEDWLQKDKKTIGMYYDIDASVIRTFKVDDEQFSIQLVEDQLLVVEIFPAIDIQDVTHLNTLFFHMWAQIDFRYSFVQRDLNGDNITYSFITGADTLGYQGRFIFRGDIVTRLLADIEK